jgi:hypothetical protein
MAYLNISVNIFARIILIVKTRYIKIICVNIILKRCNEEVIFILIKRINI